MLGAPKPRASAREPLRAACGPSWVVSGEPRVRPARVLTHGPLGSQSLVPTAQSGLGSPILTLARSAVVLRALHRRVSNGSLERNYSVLSPKL